jgi:outer membrane protein OmpA-like peptidoglycan-associated protein
MADKPINISTSVQLDDVKDGMTLILRNVYYDFDKATLQQESFPELDKVVQFMKDNPTVKVEIGSHTDDVGSDEYNMVLSQKRAQSAVNYLVSKGIAKTRLVPKGYGETRPIASNDDENEGRELNRRTEFKILSH